MKMLRILALALVLLGAGFAIQPVQDWTAGSQNKITYGSEGDFITEGGNVTEVNLTSNQSTEKWAGLYGNITGTLSLAANATRIFYTWTISDIAGSKICAGTDASAFTWSAIAAATRAAIDGSSAWDFTTTDVDSATSTYTDAFAACDDFRVAGTTVASTIGVANVGGTGDFTNCAFNDGGATKGDHMFCTIAATTAILNDAVSADYALMLPTNEQDGQTETYDLFVELA